MSLILNNRTKLQMIALVLILFTALLRMNHLIDFVEWPDEIWSVWHVRGTFQEAMNRVPFDWPPLFSAVTWTWQHIFGDRLETARYMMALFGALGAAFTYQAALALSRIAHREEQANGFVTVSMLVWAAAAYSIFAGVDVRAYGMLLTLGMLAFWLALRWLNRPSARRGIMIAITLAAMAYGSYTSLPFIVLLTGAVVVMRPRFILRWIGAILILGVLCIPLAINFLAVAGGRLTVMPQPILPFGEALVKLVHDFSGSDWFIVPLVLAIALSIFAFVRFPAQRRVIIVLAVWIAVPIAVYFVTENREFWRPRYMWWVLAGLVMFIGYGLSFLPRSGYRIVALGLILLPLAPVDWVVYRLATVTSPPYRETFSWLSEHIRPNDVIVIDPKCACGDPMGWDYFVRQYFPTGYLPIVDHPGMASRVWYVSTDGFPRDDQLYQEIANGRRPSIFVGPWNFLWRLYEGPPSWQGVAFDDTISLNGVEIQDDRPALPEDSSIQVKLWWSAAKKLDLDYTFTVVIFDQHNHIVAQEDGPATAPDTPSQTSAWQPGTYYEDYRTLQLQGGLESGNYTLDVGVYQWWDGVHLKPAKNDLFPEITDFNDLIIRKIFVMSY